jgi:hypothetical protein
VGVFRQERSPSLHTQSLAFFSFLGIELVSMPPSPPPFFFPKGPAPQPSRISQRQVFVPSMRCA